MRSRPATRNRNAQRGSGGAGGEGGLARDYNQHAMGTDYGLLAWHTFKEIILSAYPVAEDARSWDEAYQEFARLSYPWDNALEQSLANTYALAEMFFGQAVHPFVLRTHCALYLARAMLRLAPSKILQQYFHRPHSAKTPPKAQPLSGIDEETLRRQLPKSDTGFSYFAFVLTEDGYRAHISVSRQTSKDYEAAITNGHPLDLRERVIRKAFDNSIQRFSVPLPFVDSPYNPQHSFWDIYWGVRLAHHWVVLLAGQEITISDCAMSIAAHNDLFVFDRSKSAYKHSLSQKHAYPADGIASNLDGGGITPFGEQGFARGALIAHQQEDKRALYLQLFLPLAGLCADMCYGMRKTCPPETVEAWMASWVENPDTKTRDIPGLITKFCEPHGAYYRYFKLTNKLSQVCGVNAMRGDGAHIMRKARNDGEKAAHA